jgi:hypothetical protein
MSSSARDRKPEIDSSKNKISRPFAGAKPENWGDKIIAGDTSELI